MNDRVGQIWDILMYRGVSRAVYLVLDPGERDDRCKRYLHRAMNVRTGDVSNLQEVDGCEWEKLAECVRFG